MTKLQEKRQELEAKQKALRAMYEEAGGADNLDLSKIKSLGELSDADKLSKLREKNAELDALGTEIKQLNDLVEQAKASEVAAAKAADPNQRTGAPQAPGEQKTLGQMIVSGKAHHKGAAVDFPEFNPRALKAVFQRAGVSDSGYAPESIRVPGLVLDFAFQEPQIIDVVPAGTTSQAVVKYMEMVTRTNSAAERSEGAALAESGYEYEEKSQTVESVGHILPVTEEQLADVPGIESLLDNVMLTDLRRRVSSQMLVGNGTAPNLRGLNTAVTQTQPKGGDSAIDAIFKAGMVIATTGFGTPNAVILHPLDWQEIRLSKTTTGDYLFGNPSIAGFTTLWGWQRVLSTEETENQALVGDFNSCQFFTREGMKVETGLNAADFKNVRLSIRALIRGAMVVLRISNFTKVTGI